MAYEEALRELEASLSRPSSTPCTWEADRDAYISRMREDLRKHLIEPFMVKAIASAWAQKWVNQPANDKEMIALAREEDTWLLYDPASREFAKAFGRDGQSQLSLLGFASEDALAEWLG